MAKVIWTPSAVREIKAIGDYIAQVSLVGAERFTTEILAAPKRLKDFPLSGQVVPDLDQDHIREIVYRSYRIVYLHDGQSCFIISVIHAMAHPNKSATQHLKNIPRMRLGLFDML